MSTQVTVHRMVTTTTTSAVLLNVGYIKTLPGILKVFQIILSCIAIGIIGHYITSYTSRYSNDIIVPELFFLLVATTALICTTLLLLSCLCSIATASIMPRTLFEAMYHIVACLLFFAAGLCIIIYLEEQKDRDRYYPNYVPKMAAGVLGLVNTALYALSSFYSLRSFRRGG